MDNIIIISTDTVLEDLVSSELINQYSMVTTGNIVDSMGIFWNENFWILQGIPLHIPLCAFINDQLKD